MRLDENDNMRDEATVTESREVLQCRHGDGEVHGPCCTASRPFVPHLTFEHRANRDFHPRLDDAEGTATERRKRERASKRWRRVGKTRQTKLDSRWVG